MRENVRCNFLFDYFFFLLFVDFFGADSVSLSELESLDDVSELSEELDESDEEGEEEDEELSEDELELESSLSLASSSELLEEDDEEEEELSDDGEEEDDDEPLRFFDFSLTDCFSTLG